MKYVLIKTRH